MKKKKFDFNVFRKSTNSKLDKLRFSLAGAITTGLFVFVLEIFLWIKFVPLYNSIVTGIYGVSNNSEIIIAFLVVLVLGFLTGFLLSWIFAWIYNKLLSIRIK
jgi:hypothetical protein